MDSLSPSEVMAEPASIKSKPISSSLDAILNFSIEFKETPGVCSPSRKVVSKTLTFIKSPKKYQHK